MKTQCRPEFTTALPTVQSIYARSFSQLYEILFPHNQLESFRGLSRLDEFERRQSEVKGLGGMKQLDTEDTGQKLPHSCSLPRFCRFWVDSVTRQGFVQIERSLK